jgi:hypothetical protein
MLVLRIKLRAVSLEKDVLDCFVFRLIVSFPALMWGIQISQQKL